MIKCLAGNFQALVDVVVKYMDESDRKDLSDLKASDPIAYQAFMDWISLG